MITRPPIPALRPFVSLVWASADTATERFAQTALEHVLPTGAMHLVIRLTDDPLRIYDSSDDPIGQSVGDSIIGGARSRFYVRETLCH